MIQGVSEAPQNVSFAAMARGQQALAQIILQDPAVESLSSFIGIDGTNTTLNSGRILINLKPLEERKTDISDVIHRLQPKLAAVDGITLYLQPVQDLTVEDRVSRTQYQYSLEDPNAARVDRVDGEAGRQAQDVAGAAQRGERPAERRLQEHICDRSGDGVAAGHHAAPDRQHALRRVRPAADVDDVHAAESVPRRAGSRRRSSSTIRSELDQHLYHDSNRPGGEVPLSAFTHFEPGAAPLVGQSSGTVSGVTISFDLAPGYSLGDAVTAIDNARQGNRDAGEHRGAFQGTAEAFRASLTNEPLLILAALITVYIVLGVLYESYIHPITILSTLPSAGVGAILALMICRQDLSVIALIGIILLIGIVKKNAIMMIDFALEAERQEGKPPREAIYQACLLRFRPIMMTTMAALLGGLPLALGTGVGSELRRPLGITIVGGLLVSQVLTLYTTPVIFLTFDRLAHANREVAGKGRRAGNRSGPSVMSLSEPFIRKPVATTLLTIAIALAGVIAFRLLPVSPLPQVDFPTIQVGAGLPGASPETMASSVATPLERQFGRIAGLTEMTSTSYLGATSIALQFDLNRNIDAAARDVQAAINAARGTTAVESAGQADLSKGQSCRCADHDSGADVGRRAPGNDVRRGSIDSRAEALADRRRRAGHVGGSALPAVRVELNPTQMNQPRPRPRGRADRAGCSQCEPAER